MIPLLLAAPGMLPRVLLIGCSAALHALAFPPWNVPSVVWVALVPFITALRGLDPLRGLAAGALFGTAAIWGVGYWVPSALAVYYQQPFWFGWTFAFATSVMVSGTYAAGFGMCVSWLDGRLASTVRPVAIAALWVSWELARARFLTGDPWILLGYSLVPETRLIQVADLGGVYALSFLIVLTNASLVEAWNTRTARPLALAGVLVAAAFGYGSARLAHGTPTEPTVPIAIVQGNNDLGAMWRQAFHGQGLEDYLDRSYAAAARTRPMLLVWPESAVSFFLADEPSLRAPIARMLAATDAELIVGGPYRDGNDVAPKFYNSAFLMGPDGRIRGRYDKRHLLPFAEYFPWRTIELVRRQFERVRYFTPGGPAVPLATRLGPVATVVCFEAIFPELVRTQMAAGATMLVNLSNDAWLGRGAAPEQHLAMVTLRAVENRTWVIRAATTGISALIDPFGRIVARTETFVPAVLQGKIAPRSGTTVYQSVGDAFAYACVGACAVGLLTLAVRKRPDAA